MNGVPALGSRLAAWRAESLRPPEPAARERAREAMHAARARSFRSRGLPLAPHLRLRLRHPVLAGLCGVVAGATLLGVLGWNAPAGSPLFGVRVARQGVQLALPGADAATLHLEFAEVDLADARGGIDPSSSLADARAELAAALPELPADHGSPLWSRYDGDLTVLATEQVRLQSPPAPPAPATLTPSAEPSQGEPDATGTPEGTAAAGSGQHGSTPGSTAKSSPTGSAASGSPTPCGDDDDCGGGDGGGGDG